MTGYVVMVDFRLHPGTRAAFRKLVDENARASCRDEPGCRRFDVLEPSDSADRIFLYEIYDDRQAFDAHKRTSHFAAFDAASAPHVAAKTVTTHNLVLEGSDPGR